MGRAEAEAEEGDTIHREAERAMAATAAVLLVRAAGRLWPTIRKCSHAGRQPSRQPHFFHHLDPSGSEHQG